MHHRVCTQAALLAVLLTGSAHSRATAPRATEVAKSHPERSAASLLAWKPRAWAPPATMLASSPGLRVERDPVDGTLSMPAPDRFRSQLVEGERRPTSVTRLANGAIRAQLGEDFAEYAVVRFGPDGKPRWTCVQGPDGAERFMRMQVIPNREPGAGTAWEVK
jgi:hypothetical protein